MKPFVLGLASLTCLLGAPRFDEGPTPLRIHFQLEDSDPTLDEAGRLEIVPYTVAAKGRLYLFALSDAVDLILRVGDEAGSLLAQDDDGGGGTVPFIALEVAAGDALLIFVASKNADLGEGILQITPAPETTETLRAARAASRALEAAAELEQRGDLDGAREVLAREIETLLAVPGGRTSTAVQRALANLGHWSYRKGGPRPALRAWDEVHRFRTLTLPPEHPDLAARRQSLAATLTRLGELAAARDLLEQVLEGQLRALPDEHPELQTTRMNLASTLAGLGDLVRAYALFQKVFEVRSRTLSDHHIDLQDARWGLASTLFTLGDLAGARALEEKILDVYLRTVPDDDPRLQSARFNLAVTLKAWGDVAAARTLEEKVLEVRSRQLPDDHPELQEARVNLAVTLRLLSDLESARALEEKVLEIHSRTVDADHPGLQAARLNHALTLDRLGELGAARDLMQKAYEIRKRTLPGDHPDLQATRRLLAWTTLRLGDREACESLLKELAAGVKAGLESGALHLSPRNLEALAAGAERGVSTVLSAALGAGASAPFEGLHAKAFAMVESCRAAASTCFALKRLRAAAGDSSSKIDELSRAIREASMTIARVSQVATAAEGEREALLRAVRDKERAQERLTELLEALPAAHSYLPKVEASAIAESLRYREAAIGYWRYRRSTLDPKSGARNADMTSYLAYVLVRGGALRCVDLGPAAAIESAVDRWRQAIGTPVPRGVETNVESRPEGEHLRSLILDPILAILDDADRLVVALDGALHLVPLDALPDGKGVVGDRVQIVVRSALRDLTLKAPGFLHERSLLCLGDIDYDSPVFASAEAPPPAATTHGEKGVASRPGIWERGFLPLPRTGYEVTAIGAIFKKQFPDAPDPTLLSGRQASKEALVTLAEKVRHLHVATHGYFAPETIPSVRDPRPVDARLGLDLHSDLGSQVTGLAPLALCGLALAGANQPPDALGRLGGILTGEEIAALDLSGCDLAILSACDTSTGLEKGGLVRGGQGIASLEQALEAAGVRTSITSLWQVGDEPAAEFMVDFYRRLWVLGQSKAQAFREAKARLRRMRDPQGRPVFATRDWAGWVLSGDPD